MHFNYLLKSTLALSLCSVLFVGCSSDSSSNTDTDSSSLGSETSVNGILVDPFITGAILCEDADKNGACGISEQVSTATDSSGSFEFENELTVGSHIIIKEQGFHNGVPYTLDIAGVVDSEGQIDVVSPLTTLQTKNLSASQIKSMLHNAGLTNVTDEDIFANPLEGGLDTLTDDNSLRRLHATLATYGMLKILEGSVSLKALSSDELINSSEVNTILTAMISAIKETLSKSTLENIETQASSFSSSIFTPPEVSVSVVAATAITIIDALTKVAYETCNQTDGSDSEKVSAALNQFSVNKDAIVAKMSDLGMRYYAMENRSVFNAIPAQYQSLLPQAIKDALATTEGNAVILNASSFDIEEQSSEVANFILEAYADTTSQAQITTVSTCPANHIGEDQPHYAAGLDCDGDGGTVAFETPRKFKVAFKSLALVNQAGEKKYIINKSDLNESVVFDISDPKILGDLTIAQGTYTSVYAEIYYYWLDMKMYSANEYTQFRVYMSDDNRAHATEGHHQGDVTLTDANNTELGWLSPGGKWKLNEEIAVRAEPNDPNIPLYASTKDADTNRQRGPFGDNTLWDTESLNPNDVFTITQSISNLVITKESKVKITFNVKNNWYWEDYNGDNIFGAAEHKSADTNITEAADINATWAPILGLPTITKVY